MEEKVLDCLPLTPDGWAQAWTALVKLDPGAAEAVAKTLQEWLGQRSSIRSSCRVIPRDLVGAVNQYAEVRVYTKVTQRGKQPNGQ